MGEKESKVEKQKPLFDCSPYLSQDTLPPEPKVKVIEVPVWTNNKAKFIMCYLRYFVLLTKHGTYIDGFAGPQPECDADPWAAKLVLASEPRWLKHFHLCDQNREQITRLKALMDSQPRHDSKGRNLYRKIHIHDGDFNIKVDEILPAVSQRQATFCLLDQRTFECHWQTVEKLAHFKKSGNKIEIFYFLANGWLERALAGQHDTDVIARWWGRDDWANLRAMSREARRDALVDRMRTDLNYKSVKPWPIYERDSDGGGAIMYYMIHATDHPEAPKLMSRAYRRAVYPLEPIEQLKLELLGDTKGPASEPKVPHLTSGRASH